MRKRLFSHRQRNVLAWVSGGICQICGKKLDNSFHTDHVLPYSRGGMTVTNNGQALCLSCNCSKGDKL